MRRTVLIAVLAWSCASTQSVPPGPPQDPREEPAEAAPLPREAEESSGNSEAPPPPPDSAESSHAADTYADAPPPPAPATPGEGVRSLAAEPREPSRHGSAAAAPAPPRPTSRAEKGKSRSRSDESYEAAAPTPGLGAAAPVYAPAPVEAPALKAGRHDDNRQYNRFLAFLNEHLHLAPYRADIAERLVLRTVDKDGKALANCTVLVKGTDGRSLSTTVTFADGRTQFFPRDAAEPRDQDFVVEARCGAAKRSTQLSRTGRREVEVRFPEARKLSARVPVDIGFAFDTSGSMQSQIDRLKKTLKAIHFQLTQLSTKPDLRFGLVAYRDRGDEYVTRVTPFTSDLKSFQMVLDRLEADGGGDTPEDLQEALDKSMHALEWRADALRLGFIVADAVPHTDYGQQYTYLSTMREALGRGIKWVSVGVGGLPREGEVIFRQIAQYTMGEYVFVTEGGGGDAEGGVAEASHHVGANYGTENLDQALVRIVRRELSYMTDAPVDFDYTIVAKEEGRPRDEVLAPAVAEVLRQLADYSAIKLEPKSPLAVVPVSASKGFEDVGGYLTDQMILHASRNPSFRLVERDLQAVSKEMNLQLTDLFDVTETAPFGKMVGADVLIVAKLTVRGEEAELFAKLVRVATGEILSVAKVDLTKGVLRG